jgi:DNA-binding NarL/FixJ family response regulator
MCDIRKITEQQEKAYRLVHHDFAGLSKEMAANLMKISVQAINRLLSEVKKAAPQLFPILTPEQAKVKRIYDQGFSIDDIANQLNFKERRVQTILGQLRKLGAIAFSPKIVSYRPHMDDEISERY